MVSTSETSQLVKKLEERVGGWTGQGVTRVAEWGESDEESDEEMETLKLQILMFL